MLNISTVKNHRILNMYGIDLGKPVHDIHEHLFVRSGDTILYLYYTSNGSEIAAVNTNDNNDLYDTDVINGCLDTAVSYLEQKIQAETESLLAAEVTDAQDNPIEG